MNNRIIILLFLLATLAGAGCTTVQTVPIAGRPGDTILMSVGSPEGMDASNTSLVFNPGNVPLTIRSIFNIYPSKESTAWINSDALSIEEIAGHGPWTTVIAVDLPTSGLTVGIGSISITTTAIPGYISPLPDINNSSIALEILPPDSGIDPTGSPNPFNYEGFGGFELTGDLSFLEPMPRVTFKPTWNGAGSTTYGAAEVALNIPNIGGLDENNINIIVDEKMNYANNHRAHHTWSINGDILTVYFISPIGALQYNDIHFSIISSDLMTLFDAGASSVAAITVTSTWYDIEGNVDLGGPAINKIDETGI